MESVIRSGVCLKRKQPDCEVPRGCRGAGDPRGVNPQNVPVDCKLGYAVADRDSAPNMAPMEFGAK